MSKKEPGDSEVLDSGIGSLSSDKTSLETSDSVTHDSASHQRTFRVHNASSDNIANDFRKIKIGDHQTPQSIDRGFSSTETGIQTEDSGFEPGLQSSLELSISLPQAQPLEDEHKLFWQQPDPDGDTEAMIAAGNADDGSVQRAVYQCQDPQVFLHTNLMGQTVLHVAAMFCHYQTIEVLLRSGCDASMRDCFGNTALHYAADRGDESAVAALITQPNMNDLHHGNFTVPFSGHPSACISCLNHLGKSAIHIAAEKGHHRALEVLSKSKFVDIDQRRRTDGYSIAHIAIGSDDMNLLARCLDLGVDSEVRNYAGYTPMQMALMYQRDEMVDLCHQRGASWNQLELMDIDD